MVFDPDKGCVGRPFGRRPKGDFPLCCPYHEDGGLAGLPCPSYAKEPEPPTPSGFRDCGGCGDPTVAHKTGPHHAKWCIKYTPGFEKLEDAVKEASTDCWGPGKSAAGGYTEDCMVMLDGKCVSPFCDLHDPLPPVVGGYDAPIGFGTQQAKDEAELVRAFLRGKFKEKKPFRPPVPCDKSNSVLILHAALDLLDRYANQEVVSARNLIGIVLDDLERREG